MQGTAVGRDFKKGEANRNSRASPNAKGMFIQNLCHFPYVKRRKIITWILECFPSVVLVKVYIFQNLNLTADYHIWVGIVPGLISHKLLVGGVDESCTRTCQPSDETQSVFTSKKLWRTNFKMKMWEKGFMNCSYDQLIEHFFHG